MESAVANQLLGSWLWRTAFASHGWLAGRSHERSECLAKAGSLSAARAIDRTGKPVKWQLGVVQGSNLAAGLRHEPRG